MLFRNYRISAYQLFTLLCCFMIGSTLVVSPASGSKQDAWLAFLLGICGGAVLVLVYVFIARQNPGRSMVGILEYCFGRIPGKILALLYIWYFVHLASLVLRNFGEYAVTTSYPETPILFIIVCFTVVVILSVRSGIEVMGRISEIFIVILSTVLIFVFFALIIEFDVENVKPILAEGMKPLLKSAFGTMTFPFGECVVFLMIFPYVAKQRKTAKSAAAALVFVGLILLSTILRNTMVLGADMASRDVFPSHIVFRLIPNLDLDPLLDINFTVTSIIKVGICIYAAVTALTEIFGLEDYRFLVLPLGTLIVSMSVWMYDSLMEMTEWANDMWPLYSIPFQIAVPLMMLIISLVRNRMNTSKNAAQQ